MKFDFDKINDRRDSGSLKWNVKNNELPMWVADMDFETAPIIKETIINRAKTGIFGYSEPDENWFNAYISFYERRHNFKIEKDWLLFSSGVVPTISSSVRKLTKENDGVILTPPVYNIFYNSIINNKRKVIEVPLLNKNNDYFFDFENLEKAFAIKSNTLFILCNPHNPVGRIWKIDELRKIGQLAKKYNVIVLSDEIHGELTRPNTSYVPFLSINNVNKDVGFAAISVTKSFNLAGIQTSAIIVPKKSLRDKINRQINTDEIAEGNVFSYLAATVALNKGEDWLDELRSYLFINKDYACDYINKNIPSLVAIKSDATYLLWIDASKLKIDSDILVNFLRKETGLILSSGKAYGKGGNGYLRLNLACPKSILNDGLSRLKRGIDSYLKNI